MTWPHIRGTGLDALAAAIWAYEKGFYLKDDYYNGINFAFLLNCGAAELGGDDAIADRVGARRVRERVVGICRRVLINGVRGERDVAKRDQEYWIRATLAEALLGLAQTAESDVELAAAKALRPEGWMLASTDTQLAKLRALPSAPARDVAGRGAA